MSKPIRWTAAHRREALRRTYEIAAEMVATATGDMLDLEAYMMVSEAITTDERWRESLRHLANIDTSRIDREVRRVDGLATGRLVRETSDGWRVVYARGERGPIRNSRAAANAEAPVGAALIRVRVTRIRRRA